MGPGKKDVTPVRQQFNMKDSDGNMFNPTLYMTIRGRNNPMMSDCITKITPFQKDEICSFNGIPPGINMSVLLVINIMK